VSEVASRRQRLKLPPMEGALARWYARQRRSASQLAAYRDQAAQLVDGLPDGTEVLEVAPGPGYLVIEMARLGRVRVTGLDISRSFLAIAAENARQAGVRVDFRQGDAASLPFDAESFDLVVCQAAFKNFARPLGALDEMHRVLRSGGRAVIHDMRRDASDANIDQEVRRMGLGWVNGFMTKWPLVLLRRRAYSPAQFQRLAAESAFRTCDIQPQGIGMEVRLNKQAAV
jgi:ubiquinone/menaquinone biosynthesis C-methylase UbiE